MIDIPKTRELCESAQFNALQMMQCVEIMPDLCDEVERLQDENDRLEEATEVVHGLIDENAELEINNDILQGRIHELEHGLKGRPASEALEGKP